MISFDDFVKVELKVGTILTAEDVKGSEKLIKCMVDLGEDPSTGSGRDIRQILAGVKQWYKAGDLAGKQVVVVANLKPRMMMGLESQGMLLASGEEKPIFLKPSSKVSAGSKVC